MPHTSASPAGARRAGSGQAGGRPTLSPADRLDQLSSRLDELTRDLRLAPSGSHRETERRIAEAEEIAAGIRDIFRAPTRRENPPLSQSDGQAWW